MDFRTLKTLINSEPANTGKSDIDVVAWCNTLSVTRQTEFMFTVRAAMSSLGPVLANTVLTKLEAASVGNPILQRTLNMMSPSEGGIDLGHPATRAQINALVTATVLTASEGAALKALGEKIISPAQQYGLGNVTAGQVQAVRRRMS